MSEPSPAPISRTRSPSSHVGQARDAAHGIGIDDEVLAQRPRRFESVFVEQRPKFGARMGHHETLTSDDSLGQGG